MIRLAVNNELPTEQQGQTYLRNSRDYPTYSSLDIICKNFPYFMQQLSHFKTHLKYFLCNACKIFIKHVSITMTRI